MVESVIGMNPVSPLEILDSGKTVDSESSSFAFDGPSVSKYLREVAHGRPQEDSGVSTRHRSNSLPLSSVPNPDTRYERKRKIDRVLLGDMGPIPSARRQLMSTTHSSEAICKTIRLEIYSTLDWQKPLTSTSTPSSDESSLVVSSLREQLARKYRFHFLQVHSCSGLERCLLLVDQSLASRPSIRSSCPTMALRRSYILGTSATPYSGRTHCSPICGGCRAMELSSSIIMEKNSTTNKFDCNRTW